MTANKLRIRIGLSLAAVVPLGILLKFYAGPYQAWVNNSAAGMVYELFWCLALFAIWPYRRAINRIVIGVFVATCGLEAMQLWHPPLLQAVRSTFPGRVLIGTTFAWSDFAHYAVGSGIGWLWLRWISRSMPYEAPRRQ